MLLSIRWYFWSCRERSLLLQKEVGSVYSLRRSENIWTVINPSSSRARGGGFILSQSIGIPRSLKKKETMISTRGPWFTLATGYIKHLTANFPVGVTVYHAAATAQRDVDAWRLCFSSLCGDMVSSSLSLFAWTEILFFRRRTRIFHRGVSGFGRRWEKREE